MENPAASSAGATAYRLLLAGAFCIAFSIAAGEVFLLLAALAAAAGLWRARRGPAVPAVFWFAAVFAAIALITGCLGLDPGRSLAKSRRLLWFLGMILLAATVAPAPERRRAMLKAYALGALVLAAEAVVWNPLAAWRDVRSGVAGATDYWTAFIHRGAMTDAERLMAGALAALGLWLGAAGGEGRDRRVWLWVLLGLAAGLVLNFKRGSLLCAGLCAVAFIAAARGAWRVWPVAALALVALALPPVRSRLADIRTELTLERGGRAAMWLQVAPELVRRHPWKGVGYAALNNETMRGIAPQIERGRKHLHSNPIQVLVETGWLGLLAYLAWMGRSVADHARMVRSARAGPSGDRLAAMALLFVLLALLLNGLVEYNFGDTELILVYGLAMGMAGAATMRAADACAAGATG